MKITASKINGKYRVDLNEVYRVIRENTIEYCDALRELYELGFSDNPYHVDDILLRKAYIEEFEDSKLLTCVSSGGIDFDKLHLKYAMWVSKDEDFVNACRVYLKYITSKEKLEVCGEILDNAKTVKKGSIDINVRFVASEGVVLKTKFRLLPDIFVTDEMRQIERVNVGDCVIHALIRDLGISDEEYERHLSTGSPFFVKGVSQEQECELIDAIICYGIPLEGKYGSLLAKSVLDYYRDYMMHNESKFAQATYESIIFTKSADYKTAKLNEVRERIYKEGGKELFMEENNVYYCLPNKSSHTDEDSSIKVGGWCLNTDGEMLLTKDLFKGVQGVFSFNEKYDLPAYIDGYGLCYFVPNSDYVKSTYEEQFSAYDSVSPSELRLLVRKFVTSDLAEELILAVLSARCDDFDYTINISKDDLVEEEYYNACEEAVQALQYTFNLV